jgi:S1-C subfamily serine protease
MRAVRAGLAALFVSLTLPAVAPPASAEPSADALRARASMVIVSSHIAEHRDAIGAGVVVAIEPHRIRAVTARHVADNGPVTLWVNGRPWAAEIVRTFADRDLAVVDAVDVRLDTRSLRAASVTDSVPAGSELFVWGEDEAGLRVAGARLVSAAYQPPGEVTAEPLLSIACDACAHGDSGAGIFDAQGKLVGVLTARYHTPQNRTVALVGERIDPSLFTITDGPFAVMASRSKGR